VSPRCMRVALVLSALLWLAIFAVVALALVVRW
jgi:hypothetical protein